MPGIGDEFRVAREARHLSISDVSDQIHIRSVYLESIEAEDPSFAAPVYVRGFIRTYARFLGLDPEAAVAHFRVAPAEAGHRGHETAFGKASSMRARGGPSPWLWIAGIAVALLVAFVGFKFYEFQKAGGATSVAVVGIASPTPLPAPSASTLAAAVLPARPVPATRERTLEVRVTQDSWMSVKIDGAAQLSGIVKAGTTRAFHGKTADIRAGNAGGVELTVNGKLLGKMGNAGAVVERNLALTER